MSRINFFLSLILGEKENIESERYFLSMVSFVATIFLIILCVFHISMELKPEPFFIAAGGSVLTGVLYYFIRFVGCLFYPKLILTVFGLILLDITWYFKFLSLGPVLFFIFTFGALVIWVWEGKWLYAMILFYFANLAVLFYIEYKLPGFAFEYLDLQRRTIDIYSSFFLYVSLMIFVLWRVKKDFIAKREEAIRSDKFKSAFLANMSHEIRTPLNAIAGFTDLLELNPNPEEKKKYLEIIRSSSDKLLHLINEIIDLSKIEAGYIQLSYTGFSIEEMFAELKRVHQVELSKRNKKDVRLDYHLPDGDFQINSDFHRLSQVLSNLLNNAIKFTTKGSIIFSCRKKEDFFLFEVYDTGIGIPEEDQDKIFDRFVKFDYDGMNMEGSGIGLSIVNKIITILKGKIWFESEPGKGTRFYFTIPALDSSKNKKTLQNPEKAISAKKTVKKILLVEDDQMNAYLIFEIMRSYNIEIKHVKNGREAIDFIRQNPDTDLILMDLKMPHINGFEATSEIKKIKPDVTIIAQSALVLETDRNEALKAGCSAFISKPIDMKEFRKTIESYLQKKN